MSAYDFLDAFEKGEVTLQFKQMVKQLNLAREPSAQAMYGMVVKGVAFHHAGMLPMLKEVVERLFTNRLIKVIFTTETFALGINMPSRSVVFDELRKFYNDGFRTLQVRDFFQMAGRAGRRGMDECGFVYSRINPRYISRNEIKHLMFGNPEPIISQFNTAYATLLNLYRKHGEDLIKTYPMSFHFFQSPPAMRKQAHGLLVSKLKLLSHIRYITPAGLTPKGDFASCLYGYELPVGNLFSDGYLEQLSPTGLNVLICGLVFESRRHQIMPRLSKIARPIRNVADGNAASISKLERKFGIGAFSKQPYFHAAPAIEAFSQGADFRRLRNISDIDEGELVRVFRTVIQVQREIHSAPGVSDALKKKTSAAIASINRDFVNAEDELKPL
jgi:superfamily II RNA helicase